eukprot:scaffold1021_cov108-Isochrysis_galbana.AAC.20
MVMRLLVWAAKQSSQTGSGSGSQAILRLFIDFERWHVALWLTMLPCVVSRGRFGDAWMSMTVSFGSEAEGAARAFLFLFKSKRFFIRLCLCTPPCYTCVKIPLHAATHSSLSLIDNTIVRKTKAARRLILERAEGGVDLLVELHEALDEHVFAVGGERELLGGDLVDGVTHGCLDAVPRYLVVGGRVLDGLLRQLVEVDHVLHHPHRLVEGARLVDELVRLGQRVLANELHNLGQVILRLEELTHDGAHRRELGEISFVPRIEGARVLGVGNEPVDRREVLALGELLIEAPEDLDNAEGGRADWVGEVAAGRRDGADDRDGAVALGRAGHGALARALVEGGQAGTEVGGVAGVGGHLGQAARDLTERLGPARGGVGHHGHVEAHVAHVLGEGDARVDGRLAGGDGHVGRVGHKGGAFHDRLDLAVDLHGELGEVLEHLGHLVAALAASDVDDAVRVGELGQRLRDDRLAAAEGAGHSAGAAEHRGKERVDDTLAGEERHVAHQLLGGGARRAHRPEVLHGDARLLALKGHLCDGVIDRVLAPWRQVGDGAHDGRWHHNLVRDDVVLGHLAENVAAGDGVANLDELRRVFPHSVGIEGRGRDSTGNVDGLRYLGDLLERALNAIVNAAHHARAKLERERLAGAHDRVAHGQPGGLLVDLDGGLVELEPNDLTDQLRVAHTNQLVHLSAGHLVGDDDGAGHRVDAADKGTTFRHDVLRWSWTVGGRAGTIARDAGWSSKAARLPRPQPRSTAHSMGGLSRRGATCARHKHKPLRWPTTGSAFSKPGPRAAGPYR